MVLDHSLIDDSLPINNRRESKGKIEKKVGDRQGQGRAYLFTQLCLDLEQVNLEAFFHLARLLLGCCFFSTQVGNLLRRQENRAILLRTTGFQRTSTPSNQPGILGACCWLWIGLLLRYRWETRVPRYQCGFFQLCPGFWSSFLVECVHSCICTQWQTPSSVLFSQSRGRHFRKKCIVPGLVMKGGRVKYPKENTKNKHLTSGSGLQLGIHCMWHAPSDFPNMISRKESKHFLSTVLRVYAGLLKWPFLARKTNNSQGQALSH